jgi:hypothetical protein
MDFCVSFHVSVDDSQRVLQLLRHQTVVRVCIAEPYLFGAMLFRLQTKHASFLRLSCPCYHTAAESQAL